MARRNQSPCDRPEHLIMTLPILVPVDRGVALRGALRRVAPGGSGRAARHASGRESPWHTGGVADTSSYHLPEQVNCLTPALAIARGQATEQDAYQDWLLSRS